MEDRIRKRVLYPLRCDLFWPILILCGSGSLNPLFGTNLRLSARFLSQTGNFFALGAAVFRRTAFWGGRHLRADLLPGTGKAAIRRAALFGGTGACRCSAGPLPCLPAGYSSRRLAVGSRCAGPGQGLSRGGTSAQRMREREAWTRRTFRREADRKSERVKGRF